MRVWLPLKRSRYSKAENSKQKRSIGAELMNFVESVFQGENAWLYGMIFIFFARICDVSIGTIRIILVAKGKSILAPIFGFFEVLIWISAVGSVIQQLDNLWFCMAYASGFAAGNYIGILIEKQLAIGSVMVRIITSSDASHLIQHLRRQKFRVTSLPAQGNEGNVNLIFTIVKRKNLQSVLDHVHEYHPEAFYTVEDVRTVMEKAPPNDPAARSKYPTVFAFGRQGK